MNESWMNGISPFVRAARTMSSSALAGEWMDHDHVYTYIDQGEAEFILNGVKYTVQEGDVLLMHPFMPHIITSTSAVPLTQYIFHFDLYYDEHRSFLKNDSENTLAVDNAVEHEKQLAFIHPLSHLDLADRFELKKRFLQMQKELMDQGPGSALILKSICLELLYLFFKNQTQSLKTEGKKTTGWPIIERAIRFIHECYSDPHVSNESISGYAGVTVNHLSYLFKTQLGVTIHNYLKQVRIEQAKLRIIEGKQTLTEIAEATGFSSIHLFSRTFKAIVGVMPSKYAATQSVIYVELNSGTYD